MDLHPSQDKIFIIKMFSSKLLISKFKIVVLSIFVILFGCDRSAVKPKEYISNNIIQLKNTTWNDYGNNLYHNIKKIPENDINWVWPEDVQNQIELMRAELINKSVAKPIWFDKSEQLVSWMNPRGGWVQGLYKSFILTERRVYELENKANELLTGTSIATIYIERQFTSDRYQITIKDEGSNNSPEYSGHAVLQCFGLKPRSGSGQRVRYEGEELFTRIISNNLGNQSSFDEYLRVYSIISQNNEENNEELLKIRILLEDKREELSFSHDKIKLLAEEISKYNKQ